MIKIKRSKCPKVLAGSPKTGTHYNKKKVVKTLWEMQNHKCCYCEMEIPPEGHLKAVEHFSPQSVYKKKRNDWKNLLLACAQCNGKKSNKFPTILAKNKHVNVLCLNKIKKASPLLIEPSNNRVDPEKHITFIVDETRAEEYGLAIARNSSRRGRTTINTIGLYGTFYVRKRRMWHSVLRALHTNLLLAKIQENQHNLRTMRERFRQYMSSRNEFAAYTREFVRQKGLHSVPFKIEIPTGYEV